MSNSQILVAKRSFSLQLDESIVEVGEVLQISEPPVHFQKGLTMVFTSE